MDEKNKKFKGFGGEKNNATNLPFKVADVADTAEDQILLGFIC